MAPSSILEQAIEALDAGDFGAARQLAEAAVRAADGPRRKSARFARRGESARASARRILALALLYEGRGDEAKPMAAEAIRVARASGSRGESALAELALAEILHASGDHAGAMRQAAHAQKVAGGDTDARTHATVLAEYAAVLSRLGDDERACEAFERLIDGPLSALPEPRALLALCNASIAYRSAGRFDVALAILDRARDLAPGPASRWPLASATITTLLDLGAIEPARAVLEGIDENALGSDRQRLEHVVFRASVALAAGARAELVESFVVEGLASPGLDLPLRFALERIRASSLIQRGRSEEAEQIAVGIVAAASKRGARSDAALGLAIVARAGSPEAWLLRWLGVVACASSGSAARTEHEAYAALATEPDPIGRLARSALVIVRARLLDRTPQAFKKTMLRTLRQVEQRATALRQSNRAEAELVVGDEVLRAKDEVGIAGSSPALTRAVATIARAARSNASLVVYGETGSGKELFARLGHRISPRSNAPFVAVNCAAIPHPLLEAELFGHERGAFTGAERARRGLFASAEGGTLFLDEVGEMSTAMQAKLLRVLEDGQVRAIGGTRSRKVDVRVIAATHRDLATMVASGTFREDLYYRLAAITVRVPSLRERPEDLPAVARALLARDPDTKDQRLDVPALALLAEHAWPGNVRELANVLRVAAAMEVGRVIGREALAAALDTARLSRSGAREAVQSASGGQGALMETTLAALRERHRAEVRELVGRAIAGADGNKRRAARTLGVSRQGLYRVLDG